ASAALVNQPLAHHDASAPVAESSRQASSTAEKLPHQPDIGRRWEAHQALEQIIAYVRQRQPAQALHALDSLLAQDLFSHDHAAYVSLFAIFSCSDQPPLLAYAQQVLTTEPALVHEHHTGGRTLLHDVAANGSLSVLTTLLSLGADPNAIDQYGHT